MSSLLVVTCVVPTLEKMWSKMRNFGIYFSNIKMCQLKLLALIQFQEKNEIFYIGFTNYWYQITHSVLQVVTCRT